jgi:hypothetical protein
MSRLRLISAATGALYLEMLDEPALRRRWRRLANATRNADGSFAVGINDDGDHVIEMIEEPAPPTEWVKAAQIIVVWDRS